MRRFRILFVVIAILVVVPVALLVRRALQSVELEQRTRHQAVAERIFDEMERGLSELVVREQERPFADYDHEYVALEQQGRPPIRSPLADPPSHPFIVGYFQIDPDGSFHTPLQPQTGATISELERIVTSYFRTGPSMAGNRAAAAPQLPGTTVSVSDENAKREAEQKKPASSTVSAYDALRALNKGVEQRARLQTKAESEFASAPREEPALARRLGGADKRDAPAELDEAAGRSQSHELARIEMAPMIGRTIDARRMLLYRTVMRAAQGYRQGLLLDLDRLASWLRTQALGTDGVAAYATVTFSNPITAALPAEATSAFVYQHRFADPFADLAARLALRPLPGVGGANYVYALCALLLLAGGLGLLALYRMVSVTVRYAERRSNFVAAVSHELKTPLTAIRMYGEMLRDGIVPAEEKRAEYYRHIVVESERLSRLINNVLEFSHLEKGTRQMSLVSGSIGPVVTEAADLLRPHADRDGFALDVDVGAALPPVRFERDALLQVLFNLVDNAAKYARDGHPKRITLSCRLFGKEVHLSVRDHGPGVTPRHLRRMFEPFYRGESELTRRNKGTGLGLALVHGLAKQMGARAVARNATGGGLEVELVFPTVES